MIPIIDWARYRVVRSKIARYERLLEVLYAERKEAIQVMAGAGMTQREIGPWWGITNPRVSQILKGK